MIAKLYRCGVHIADLEREDELWRIAGGSRSAFALLKDAIGAVAKLPAAGITLIAISEGLTRAVLRCRPDGRWFDAGTGIVGGGLHESADELLAEVLGTNKRAAEE